MPQTVVSPTRDEAIGSFTRRLWGCAGGSGTSTVVTLAGGLTVITGSVIVSSATSATGAFCATVLANTFTVTTANNDLFTWTCVVRGGI